MPMKSSPRFPDTENPQLRMAQDPALMREVLQRHLQPPSGQSIEVRECRVAFTRGQDGPRYAVRYDLRLAEPATGHAWDEVVTGVINQKERTRRIWTGLRRDAPPAIDATADRPSLPAFAYVPDLDMLLQVFPHDYALPALAQLMAGPPPELAPSLLAAFGSGDWRLESDAWGAETVRYRPVIRVTVRLSVRASDAAARRAEGRRLYAKVYRDAEKGRHGDRAQRGLHDRVVAGGVPFAVAAPIAYADGLRTLVQGEVSGTPLQSILRHKDDPIPAVRDAARAVAAFHQLELGPALRSAETKISRPLQRAQRWLRAARPDLAREVATILEAVAAGLHGEPPRPTHGDLKPHHILVDGDRIALLDFDDLALGDPLHDVANLVANLVQTPSPDRAAAATRAFLEEYFAHVPAAWRARLPL